MKPTDLQLNVHEIPSAGVTLVGELPPEWAAESLLPAYRASSPVELKIEVTAVGDNFLARGTLKARLEFECSRTLAPSSVVLETPFAELFTPGTKHLVNLADEEVSSDDLVDEPWVIEDGRIDLEALVREHLVLAQDPYPVAPGAAEPSGDAPSWSSTMQTDEAGNPIAGTHVDPRWERLKNLKLN